MYYFWNKIELQINHKCHRKINLYKEFHIINCMFSKNKHSVWLNDINFKDKLAKTEINAQKAAHNLFKREMCDIVYLTQSEEWLFMFNKNSL